MISLGDRSSCIKLKFKLETLVWTKVVFFIYFKGHCARIKSWTSKRFLCFDDNSIANEYLERKYKKEV